MEYFHCWSAAVRVTAELIVMTTELIMASELVTAELIVMTAEAIVHHQVANYLVRNAYNESGALNQKFCCAPLPPPSRAASWR